MWARAIPEFSSPHYWYQKIQRLIIKDLMLKHTWSGIFDKKKKLFPEVVLKKPGLIFLCLESIKSAINNVQTTSMVPLQTQSDITWGIPATYATFSDGWKEHACKYTKASASSTNLITKYYAGLLHIGRKIQVLKKINWWKPIIETCPKPQLVTTQTEEISCKWLSMLQKLD